VRWAKIACHAPLMAFQPTTNIEGSGTVRYKRLHLTRREALAMTGQIHQDHYKGAGVDTEKGDAVVEWLQELGCRSSWVPLCFDVAIETSNQGP
jgi:hypothetical protein